MNANVNGGAVSLLPLNTFDINNVFGTVAADNLAVLGTFEVPANNLQAKKQTENGLSKYVN